MSLPTLDQFQDVLQTPQYCFTDPELKKCRTELDPLGLPRVRSGGFALTYRLIHRESATDWAVRCFHRETPDLQSRYQAISSFLDGTSSDLFVTIKYQAQGIRVAGHPFPITTMQWIEGQTLITFINDHLTDTPLLERLLNNMERMAIELANFGVAHGDLQHGNILVLPNADLRLIDYDGLFVPALAGRKSNNLGHPNYQHPRRTEYDFDATIDRFSYLVLYLGVRGVIAKPSLWNKFSAGGENLLLTQSDCRDPHGSEVLNELEAFSGLAPLVRDFRSVSQSSVANVPALSDFISRTTPFQQMAVLTSLPLPRRQYPVVSATNIAELQYHFGDVIEVVGRITAIKDDGLTKYGDRYAFLNFGNYRQGCFTIVLWKQALDRFEAANHPPLTYHGQWVSITGLVIGFDNHWSNIVTPEIFADFPYQVVRLSQHEAGARLAEVHDNYPASKTVPTEYAGNKPQGGSLSDADVERGLDRLYGKTPVTQMSAGHQVQQGKSYPGPTPQQTASKISPVPGNNPKGYQQHNILPQSTYPTYYYSNPSPPMQQSTPQPTSRSGWTVVFVISGFLGMVLLCSLMQLGWVPWVLAGIFVVVAIVSARHK